jgi:hypothetical protein
VQDACPPREVRNFRVLVVQDARPTRDPEPRRAQLTVWDVLSLSTSEGGRAGFFEEGQRFIVSQGLHTARRCSNADLRSGYQPYPQQSWSLDEAGRWV